jgi:hypothetical protein
MHYALKAVDIHTRSSGIPNFEAAYLSVNYCGLAYSSGDEWLNVGRVVTKQQPNSFRLLPFLVCPIKTIPLLALGSILGLSPVSSGQPSPHTQYTLWIEGAVPFWNFRKLGSLLVQKKLICNDSNCD